MSIGFDTGLLATDNRRHRRGSLDQWVKSVLKRSGMIDNK